MVEFAQLLHIPYVNSASTCVLNECRFDSVPPVYYSFLNIDSGVDVLLSIDAGKEF